MAARTRAHPVPRIARALNSLLHQMALLDVLTDVYVRTLTLSSLTLKIEGKVPSETKSTMRTPKPPGRIILMTCRRCWFRSASNKVIAASFTLVLVLSSHTLPL